MHLGCIIMMVFNLLFFGGFLAIYFYAEYRKRKEKELSPCLIIMKCGLALWFIFTLVIGKLIRIFSEKAMSKFILENVGVVVYRARLR